MITVVATKANASPSASNLSNLNCLNMKKKPILVKYIDTRRIKFKETVKCIYYDPELPAVKSRPHFLTQVNPNNTERLNLDNLCNLESLKLAKYQRESDLMQLEGQIIAKNMCYKKRITIRYTLTDWKTFSDTDAFFVNSIDAKHDRFMFTIRVNKSLLENANESVGISFAIKYEFQDIVYWDNNNGDNHQFILHY